MSESRMMAAYIAGTAALTEHAPEMGKISRTAIAQVVSDAAIKAYLSEQPADRLTTLEAAVRKVIDLVNAKLPPDSKMSDRDFISEVIGAVDNPDVFRALTVPITGSV